MEQRNREEIIEMRGDISHIKATTEDIKTGVAALVARSERLWICVGGYASLNTR